MLKTLKEKNFLIKPEILIDLLNCSMTIFFFNNINRSSIMNTLSLKFLK